MRANLVKTQILCMAMVLGMALNTPQALAAPILKIEPPSTTVLPSQTFTLDVVINNVTELFSFQFDLLFDPVNLDVKSVSEGTFSPSSNPPLFISGFIDNTVGSITFIADSLLGPILGIDGSGTLATASFTAALTYRFQRRC